MWVIKILLYKCLFINHQTEIIDHNSHTKHKKKAVLVTSIALISTTKISWTSNIINCVNKVGIRKMNIHYSPLFQTKPKNNIFHG